MFSSALIGEFCGKQIVRHISADNRAGEWRCLWKGRIAKSLFKIVADLDIALLSENISHHICAVANGSLDFCLGFDFSYHDIAAAICIVEQADRIITDFSGGTESLYSGESFFCSNKTIHRQLMEIQ